MIFNSYVKLPEGTWTIKQSTALGIKQLKHMERLATSRCFWIQLVASAKFLPNWNCVLIANMIFVNWNGQSELKPPKYIYHITYISLAIMPIAFHRKKIQKKSEQAMDSARNPSPGLRTCKVEVRLWCLLRWRSCRTVDPIVWEALDVRLNMCLDVLGISSESKRGLRSNWYMEFPEIGDPKSSQF